MTSSTDVSPPADDPGTTTAQTKPRPSHLSQALAWVGIVSGGLFIVGAIFFSGFFLSWHEHMAHMGPGSMDCCDHMDEHMMKPGAMMPGGMMGPGGMVTPAPQSPTTTSPNTPRP